MKPESANNPNPITYLESMENYIVLRSGDEYEWLVVGKFATLKEARKNVEDCRKCNDGYYMNMVAKIVDYKHAEG